MCGFLGFIGSPNKGFDERWDRAKSFQYHRGPDDRSLFFENVAADNIHKQN